MKKIFISLIFVLICSISSFAYRLSSDACFLGDYDGHPVVIRMYQNGECTVESRETGKLTGTYDIDSTRPLEPGCSHVKISFYLNGIYTEGSFSWPTYDNVLVLFFENVMLKRIS